LTLRTQNCLSTAPRFKTPSRLQEHITSTGLPKTVTARRCCSGRNVDGPDSLDQERHRGLHRGPRRSRQPRRCSFGSVELKLKQTCRLRGVRRCGMTGHPSPAASCWSP
jgi:hypothetical protein